MLIVKIKQIYFIVQKMWLCQKTNELYPCAIFEASWLNVLGMWGVLDISDPPEENEKQDEGVYLL